MASPVKAPPGKSPELAQTSQERFIDLLASGGVKAYTNVHKNGDLIANAEAYLNGVPPYYTTINSRILKSGLIPQYKLKKSGEQVFLVRLPAHVGVIYYDHSHVSK